MTNLEFKAIRKRLRLNQKELAQVLKYAHHMNISMMERTKSPRAIPEHVAMLMEAFDSGYRPPNWIKGRL